MSIDMEYQVDIKENGTWKLNVEKDIADDIELSPLMNNRCQVWFAFLTGISRDDENIPCIAAARGYPDDRLALARKYNLYEAEEDTTAPRSIIEDKHIEETLISSYAGFGYTWVLLSELRDYDYEQQVQIKRFPPKAPETLRECLGDYFFESIKLIKDRHPTVAEENIRLFLYFSC